mmetsp:Transcript_11202/g.21093  ORF Transcript_11202/g.21093 Transcript_11202/m.21093 type:complete len:231 (+) Transcript_11202:80-772(+)
MGNQTGAGVGPCGPCSCAMDGSSCEVRKGCRKIIQITDVVDEDEHDTTTLVSRESTATAYEPVFLNVYHLSEGWLKANNISKQILGLGGAFHAGVEVHGTEFTFGMEGVHRHEPRKSDRHVFGESVFMGETDMSAREVAQLVGDLSLQWTGDRYDVLDNNCCDFCDTLSRSLVGASLPYWVSNFSRIASAAAAGIESTVDVRQMVAELVQELHLAPVFTDANSPKVVRAA